MITVDSFYMQNFSSDLHKMTSAIVVTCAICCYMCYLCTLMLQTEAINVCIPIETDLLFPWVTGNMILCDSRYSCCVFTNYPGHPPHSVVVSPASTWGAGGQGSIPDCVTPKP